MDFLDANKKRAHRRRLVIGYVVIGAILAISTYFLALASSGYGINRSTGEIIQNGLVFLDAHPESARVYINNQDRGNTDARYVLQEGTYHIALKREGYRDWQQDVNLSGSSIERLVYPFLFPVTLDTKDLRVAAQAYDVASASPDRHWIVLHEQGAQAAFWVADTSKKETELVSITIPSNVMPDKSDVKLEAVEWSTDNKHVLLKATHESGAEFIMLDRQTPSSSINITQLFQKSFSQVALRDKRFDQLYVYESNGGVLQRADVSTGRMDVVAVHTKAFWPYGVDQLVYVTDDGAESGKVIAKLIDGSNTFNLRTLPGSDTYLLNIASFDGHQYVAVGTSTESRVYVYADPLDKLRKTPPQTAVVKALLKVDKDAEYVSFSGNARFISVQGGSKFALYDIEENRQYRYDIGLALQAHQKALWMDGHRLTLVSGSELYVFDFDGTNKQKLLQQNQTFAPMFDRDYTQLFTISDAKQQPDKTALVRTKLKLSNQ